jgi:hypothetical protein
VNIAIWPVDQYKIFLKDLMQLSDLIPLDQGRAFLLSSLLLSKSWDFDPLGVEKPGV